MREACQAAGVLRAPSAPEVHPRPRGVPATRSASASMTSFTATPPEGWPPAARNEDPHRQHFGPRKQAAISQAALCGKSRQSAPRRHRRSDRWPRFRTTAASSLAEVNAALKDGIDIAVGPCSVRVPAQAVADARAGWSALRAEAGEDAAQRIYEAMAATLPQRLEAAARSFEMDRRPNKRTMDSLVDDLVWRHVVGH